MRTALAVAAVATVALAGCTFAVSHPSVTAAGCEALHYEINPGNAGDTQLEAIAAGTDEFAAVTGRAIIFDGYTTSTARDSGEWNDGVVIIEFYWPDDAAMRLGYAEAVINGDHYSGDGFIYLQPALAASPADIIKRLVMHEWGHIGGLNDVDDPTEMMDPTLAADSYGNGDLTGLGITHPSCNTTPPNIAQVIADLIKN